MWRLSDAQALIFIAAGRHRGRAAAAVVGVSVDRERQGEIRLAEQLG
jgi:hypothetical protein